MDSTVAPFPPPSPASYGSIQKDAWLVAPGTENRTDLGLGCRGEAYYGKTGSSDSGQVTSQVPTMEAEANRC